MGIKSYFFLLFINFSIHFFSLFVIFKQQHFSSLCIRSSNLLSISTFSLFIMSSSIISYELIDKFDNILNYKMSYCNIIPFIFILCHFSFFISFIFRMQRIIQLQEINNIFLKNNVKNKANKFYSKKYSLSEIFYIKLYSLTIVMIFVILFIYFYKNKGYIPIPFHFLKYITIKDNNLINNQKQSEQILLKVNKYWIWIYFFESLLLISFIPFIYFSNFLKKIKREYYIQIFLFILYFHLTKFVYEEDSYKKFSNTGIIFLLFSYSFISISVLYPSYISYIDKIKISYCFNPKLVNNLYLFLSDEICFYSLKEYLKENVIDSYFLNLYSKIMIYKNKYTLEANFHNVLHEAKNLYNNYFSEKSENSYLNKEILIRLRNKCSLMLNNDDCTYEMFDEALVCVFEYLESKFKEFKENEEYKILVESLNISSYIKYKMSNPIIDFGRPLININK